jgi:hypothetical protein
MSGGDERDVWLNGKGKHMSSVGREDLTPQMKKTEAQVDIWPLAHLYGRPNSTLRFVSILSV